MTTGFTAFLAFGLFCAILVVRYRSRSIRAERKAAHKRGVAAGTTYGWGAHNIRRVHAPTGLPVGATSAD